jgi:hypothetical protein
MQKISSTHTIDKKFLDQYVKTMLNGTSEEILVRIANHYIFQLEQLKSKLLESTKKSPFQFIITQQLKDHKGRTIANISPYSENSEGHLFHYAAKNLHLQSFFLEETITTGILSEKLTLETIYEYLKLTPTIEEDRYGIIRLALQSFFNDDYVTFLHLIIPQIEEAIRNFVELNGGVILIPKGDAYQLKTFDHLLKDEIVIENFSEDFSFYLRAIFTDQRGWNLRNNVCHGITHQATFSRTTAYRVLHTLLCIGLIRSIEI